MTHNRLPTVPLSAAVDDTPADMKTAYKGMIPTIWPKARSAQVKLTCISDEAIAAELRELYNTFQKCLDLREKYMTKSKQRFEDNPKNKADWEVYPPPPPPSWPLPPPDELARRKKKEKEREADPIAAVGIDFHREHIKIPGEHAVSWKGDGIIWRND